MMKKLLPILLVLLCIVVFPPGVSAQGFKLPSSEVETDNFNASSLFYFLKTFKEDIGLLFVKSNKDKVAAEIKIANTRLAEINALAGGKFENKIPKTLNSFNVRVDSLVTLKDTDTTKILQQMSTHLAMMQRIYAKVKDSEVKAALAKAIYRENNLIQPILTGLSLANRRSAERFVLFRQFEAIRFLKKEANGSSLPKEYADALKQKFEVKRPVRR